MIKEMKDSGIAWIGMIPNNWNVVSLKRLSSIYTGSTPRKEENSPYYSNESGLMWIKAENLGASNPIDFTKEYITKEGIKFARIFPKNSVYVCCIASIGKTGYCEREASCNQQINVLPFENMFWKYGYYMTLAQETEYNLRANGNVMKIINSKEQGRLMCPVPSLEEQIQIVELLDKKMNSIDNLISIQEQQIEKLKEYKQSLITEVVTKGLNLNVEEKDSGAKEIGFIPANWDVRKSLYCLEMPITDGPHTTPELYEEGIPFVSAEAVSCGNGTIDFDHIRGYVSQTFYEECCKKYIPRKNDIYMIKSGATTGRVSIVDTDKIFTIWSPLAVFRCNENILIPKYLFFYLQSKCFQEQVQLGWTYGTQQNIGMRTLEKLKVVVPSKTEQQKIIDYLDVKISGIDRLIKIKEEKIEKLNEYKKSLIYEYVTGKKEVN